MPEPIRDQLIFDAHHHFWNLEQNYLPWLRDEPPIPFRYGDYRPLRRNYLPKDYTRDAAGFHIAGSVYVETEWDPADPVGESRWIHTISAETGLPTVFVAGARLDRPDVSEVLAAHATYPRVRGIRHKPRAAPGPSGVAPGSPGSMGDPAWRRGYALLAERGLSFDLQTPWWHLAEAAELAATFPETQIILNHTGLPADRSAEGIDGWRRAMRRFAEAPNVAVKISGLGLPGRPWSLADNGPIIRETIAIFGVERCMFASNYPVDGLVASFATIFDGFLEATRDFSASEREQLFATNAMRYYRFHKATQ